MLFSRLLSTRRLLIYTSNKINIMESFTARNHMTTIFNYENSSSGHVVLHADQASYKAQLPGWTFPDLSTFLPTACDPWYLRVWRVLLVAEGVRETAYKQGFMELIEYEKTNFMYHKCARLERVVSVDELTGLGHYPFQYGVTVSAQLSNIGGTSFQVDSVVSLTETDQPLFKVSALAVSVDVESRSVVSNPEWWVSKFKPRLRQGTDFLKLRVDIPKTYKPEDMLYTSKRFVQALDIDYYGHVNNSTYAKYAFDGILGAQLDGKLKWTTKEVENSIRTIDAEFVSDCKIGDLLETVVYKDETDENKIHVSVIREDTVIYLQSFLY